MLSWGNQVVQQIGFIKIHFRSDTTTYTLRNRMWSKWNGTYLSVDSGTFQRIHSPATDIAHKFQFCRPQPDMSHGHGDGQTSVTFSELIKRVQSGRSGKFATRFTASNVPIAPTKLAIKSGPIWFEAVFQKHHFLGLYFNLFDVSSISCLERCN